MQSHIWLSFFLTTLVVSLSPGAAAVTAMSAGLNHGFARGWPMAAGLALGVVTQYLIVSVGLGALIAASPLAFTVIQWAGSLYLIWIGWQQCRSNASSLGGGAAAGQTAQDGLARQLFVRGWLVNTTNPKGTVFLLALVPQFMEATRPLLPQYLAIGTTFAACEASVMLGYVAASAQLQRHLGNPRVVKRLNVLFGSLLIAAGLALLLFKR
jgi:homoserine/homoserine lactone efflux protein